MRHNERIMERDAASREARRWLTGPAAALWLEAGVDRRHGGYFDQLSFHDARNAVDFKRLRVTCRQIFVFATLDRLGVSGARDAMRHGLDFLSGPLSHAHGGFRRSVTLEGAPLDETRDLYDLAFVLFALAAAFERLGDVWLEETAQDLLGFLQAHMMHGPGGFVEAMPYRLPHRQNPHMHLLEACLAWLPLARGAHFRAQAQTLMALLQRHFWHDGRQCLFEYFEADWSPIGDATRHIFEPGHHLEWVWLLNEARRHRLDTPDLDHALVRRAHDHGFSPRTGLPYGEVHADGTVVDERCRIWTVTEWLRVGVERPDVAVGGWQDAFGHLRAFLDVPVEGLWHETCNARTYAFASSHVPASSLYHIVTGLLPLLAPQGACSAADDHAGLRNSCS